MIFIALLAANGLAKWRWLLSGFMFQIL